MVCRRVAVAPSRTNFLWHVGITVVPSRPTPATMQPKCQSAMFNLTGIFIAGLAAHYSVFVSDFLI